MIYRNDITEGVLLGTRNVCLSATNGQLEWHYGIKPWFTINTPGTIGIVGFLPSQPVAIGEITINSSNEFAVIIVSCLDPRKNIQTADKILLTTIARAKNTNMKYNEDHTELIDTGISPVLLEPVSLSLLIKNKGIPKITILDHLGNITAKTIKTKSEELTFDGSRSHAIYYLLEY